MPNGITGWYGGGRRPLTYNLMPGQFRNTRVNVFSQPMIINNNIGGFGGCYDYYDDCGCGGNKMSWMDWTMMGGMLLNGLGNIFACFWGGGGGGGGAEKAKADTPDDKTLKTQAKELAEVYGVDKKNVSVVDGIIYVNINGTVTECKDLDELKEALKTPASENPDGKGNSKIDPALKKQIETTYPGITVTDDGQFEVNGTKYKTLKDAIDALSEKKEEPEAEDFTNLLFKSGTEGLTSTALEESKFKTLTTKDVYKIGSDFSTITIDKVIDKGNKTTFDISDVKITKNNDGTLQCNPTKVNGKDVSATILGDKYIQLKVGDQTYIVAKDNNAYQYENGNVTGYNDANWR